MSGKVLGRGAHDSRSDLAGALLAFIDYRNAQARPFHWAYGEEIIHDSSIAEWSPTRHFRRAVLVGRI